MSAIPTPKTGTNEGVEVMMKNLLIMLDEVVRFSPNILMISTAAIYFMFNDLRALILLFGFAINLLLNFFLVYMIKAPRPSESSGIGCSTFFGITITKETDYSNPDYLTQFLGFFIGFFFANMHLEGKYTLKNILFLLFWIILAGYQRMLSKCVNFIHAIIGAIIGFTLGFAYYKIMRTTYQKYDNTSSEMEYTCNYVKTMDAPITPTTTK
jgi:hypothetical protein